jgi:hypothetical protein
VESDPIGLRGGLNSYGYAGGRPIVRFDRFGLYAGDSHSHMTKDALAGDLCLNVDDLAMRVQDVDAEHGTQRPENSYKHAMRNGANGESADDAESKYNSYVNSQLALCTIDGLAHALHAVQDSTAGGHSGFQRWSGGLPSASHFKDDLFPGDQNWDDGKAKTKDAVRKFKLMCGCPRKPGGANQCSL